MCLLEWTFINKKKNLHMLKAKQCLWILEEFWLCYSSVFRKYLRESLNSSKHIFFCYLERRLMMMMMNCFVVWLTDERCLALFPARSITTDPHPLRISDTPRAGFELAQNLSSGFVEWSSAVVITITPRHHFTTAVDWLSTLPRSFKTFT